MYFLKRSTKKVIENSLAGPETKMAFDLQRLEHQNVDTVTYIYYNEA